MFFNFLIYWNTKKLYFKFIFASTAFKLNKTRLYFNFYSLAYLVCLKKFLFLLLNNFKFCVYCSIMQNGKNMYDNKTISIKSYIKLT